MAPEPVSRLQLERWALGDLSSSDTRTLAELRANDPELDARMTAVQQQLRDASLDLPPLDLPREPEATPSSWTAWMRPLMVMAVAAAGAVALVQTVPTAAPPPGVVWRGASLDLEMMRVRSGEAQPLGALVTAREGDRLQYAVTPGADGYLTVVDVQDDGVISMWMPSESVLAGVIVDGAVVLDDYAGLERVYVLLTEAPVSLDDVDEAIASKPRVALADLDALPGFEGGQRSVLVVKETP